MQSEENMCYWVCFECHIPAVDPYHLTDQWIIIERPLLFYSNGTIWVSCYCIRKLHLHCCADLPSDAAEEQLEIEHYPIGSNVNLCIAAVAILDFTNMIQNGGYGRT
jgi:hypothetical protein